jgi:hypothetical protein
MYSRSGGAKARYDIELTTLSAGALVMDHIGWDEEFF